MTRSNSSSVVSAIFLRTLKPGVMTSTSASAKRCATSSTFSVDVMSRATASAVPPREAMICAVSWAPSVLRSPQMTRAPASARPTAVARPSPDAEPTTTAVRSLRSKREGMWGSSDMRGLPGVAMVPRSSSIGTRMCTNGPHTGQP